MYLRHAVCSTDMLSAGDGCELAFVRRCKCSRGKFPTNRNLMVLTGPAIYSRFVRIVMLRAEQTLIRLRAEQTVPSLNPLQRNGGSVMSMHRMKLA